MQAKMLLKIQGDFFFLSTKHLMEGENVMT